MKRYDRKNLGKLLPFPSPDAHKYSRGKLVLFAGSLRYPGAAILAAKASQRAGAGYTEVFTAPTSVPLIQASSPSLVVRSWEEATPSALVSSNLKRPCAYCVGPGFDADNDDCVAFLSTIVLTHTSAPVLVDGGALSFLATPEGRALCKKRSGEGLLTLITPHGGEAARLAAPLNLSLDNPAALARSLAQSYGVVCVLKGPDTIVSSGEDLIVLNAGTAALAKAGTGDVLAGIIGAFLAQGMDGLDAAVLGATLQGTAGSLAAEAYTPISVVAENVIDYIPAAIQDILSLKTAR